MYAVLLNLFDTIQYLIMFSRVLPMHRVVVVKLLQKPITYCSSDAWSQRVLHKHQRVAKMVL